MMKKKSHPEFVRALKARNLKITVVGTYENCLSRVAVRCDVCGWEWAPVGGSLLHGGGCPNCHRACTSFPEQFIRHAFVRMLGESEVLSRDKTAAGVELDVCIPALRAAVEPGSWYWHRNLVERDREKRLLCERKGIRLITVYDHYDETAVPFDDCLVTPCDLASRRNMGKLVIRGPRVFADNLDFIIDPGQLRPEFFGGHPPRIQFGPPPDRLPFARGEVRIQPERPEEGFRHRNQLAHIPLTEYVNSQTRMTFECRACGHVWSAQAYGLITKSRSSGCRKCSVRAMLLRRMPEGKVHHHR